MDIATIREKYPQYSDLSDIELAQGIHKSSYNDIPFDDFAKKIGLKDAQQDPRGRRMAQTVGALVGGAVASPSAALSGPIGPIIGAGLGSSAAGNLYDGFNGGGEVAAEQQPSMPIGEMASQAFSNIPSSAKRMASETWEAVKHPIDTASNIGNIAVGGAQKLIPGEQGKEVYADAIAGFFADRYGGIENVKKTIAEDPVGVLADLSTLLSGGGGAVSKLGGISKLGKLGKTAKIAGDFIDPVNLALKQPVTTAMAAASPFARDLYLGGLKGTTTKTPLEKENLFSTAVKHDIGISREGIDKAQGVKSELGGKIGEILDAGEAAGETVNKSRVTDHIADLHEGYQFTTTPQTKQVPVEKVWSEFEKSFKDEIPVRTAHKVKQNTQKELSTKKAYGKLSTPRDEANKSLAYGLRVELEKKYPELKNLDPEFGDIAELEKVLQKSVSRIDNHNLFGLTSVLAGTAAASVNPLLIIPSIIMTKIAKDPKVNSKLALSLIKARGLDARKMKYSAARQGAYQSRAVNEIKKTVGKNGKVKKIEVQ